MKNVQALLIIYATKLKLIISGSLIFTTLYLKCFNKDWRQLQKGTFKGDLFLLKDHEAQIYQFAMNRRLEFSGSGPATTYGITFGFSRQGAYSGSWCDQEIFDDSLLVWGTNGEFESIMPPLLNVNVFTLSEQLLTEAAQALDYPEPLNGILGKRLVYKIQGGRIKPLRVLFEQILRLIETRDSTLPVPSFGMTQNSPLPVKSLQFWQTVVRLMLLRNHPGTGLRH